MPVFAATARDAVAQLGERRLIAAIQRWLGAAARPAPFGIGDDCAVLPPSRRPQLLTVDPVIFGRHFDDSVPARAVGRKLLNRNASDIAAMGGRPVAGVVALTLAANTSRRWLEQFYRGLAAAATAQRIAIVGGDVAQAEGVLVASLTLLGEAAGKRVVTRAGATVGDWIFVTGELGNSLESGHHFRFTPRVAEGAWLARQREVRAMMDVSDGLAKDLHALAPAGAAPALEPAAIPRRRGASLRAALADGEDYELVFAVAGAADRDAFLRRWRRAFPSTRLTVIGRFVRRGTLPPGAVDLGRLQGYEHLTRSVP